MGQSIYYCRATGTWCGRRQSLHGRYRWIHRRRCVGVREHYNTAFTNNFLGGISYYSPEKGWACDSVKNFDIVLANGSLINVNALSNADLCISRRVARWRSTR